MTKATDDVITRGNYLDRSIVRIAARTMRQMVAEGHAPAAALRLATPGAWEQYRPDVLAFLRAPSA